MAPHLKGAELLMFHGSIVALVTPMDEQGALDESRLPQLIEHLIDAGSSGIVVAGTTGESASLSFEEVRRLLTAAIRQVDGRASVLAGTGSPDTARAMRLSREAEKLGADGVLVVTPYYNRPMPSGLLAHYGAVAGATGLPLVLYNVPSRTAVDMTPETVEKLAALDNVVAIKEAVPGAERVTALRQQCGDALDILSGDDHSCVEAMLAGASGVISVAANVFPSGMARLCDLARSGEASEARNELERYRPLLDALCVETNPIPVKWAAYELGLIGKGIRLPLLPLETHHRPGLRDRLYELGLLSEKNR